MIHRSRWVDQNMHLSSRCSELTSPKRYRSSVDARWKHGQCADKNSSFRRFFTFHQNNLDAIHQNFQLVFLRFFKHFIKGVVHFFIQPRLYLRRIMSLRFTLLLFFLFALIVFFCIFITSIFCMICYGWFYFLLLSVNCCFEVQY